MKWPWGSDEKKIEELQKKVEQQDKEIEKLESMLEAEKNRRKKHTREKQEAEEQINRLEDKLEGLESEEDSQNTQELLERKKTSFRKFKNSIQKLGSINSDKKELVTVYSPGKLSNHSKIDSIKNSVPEERLTPLLNEESLIIFYDPDLGLNCFKTRPFFDEMMDINERFKTEPINGFIERDKNWLMVSRGKTRLLLEKDGNVEEKEVVRSRVNRQHGKGGFSQGRFERKRDEQVQSHLDEVKKRIENLEEIYLLGEKGLCQDLTGKWLGGFDPNSSALQNFYRVQRLKITEK